MQKMLCPFCDHEIQGKGKCPFCGSKVKKPVYAETTADFGATASAVPNECDCNLHSPESHPHDDTYRDSADQSYKSDYVEAYGEDAPRKTATLAGAAAAAQTGTQSAGRPAGAMPRRAVLASEAVQRTQSANTTSAGNTKNKVVKVIVIIFIINLVLQILLGIFSI